MTPEKILSRKAKVVTQEQREAYFRNGYLALEGFVEQDWLDRLWQVTESFIEESRGQTQSDDTFDLEPDHTADAPRLRRLSWPVSHHPLYWEFASRGPIVDVAEDLLGPDVVFHHSKLNFKWAGGGEEVKWHQDFPFYPHSNGSVLAIGLCLTDVDDEMGPLGAIPGSHKGPIYSHYNDKDEWVGALNDDEVANLPMEKVAWMKGKAGTITIHHSRTLHGSMPNNSSRMRPLLLNAYASADAYSLTPYPGMACEQNETLIRGKRARWAEFDMETCMMPPDWSGGYSSIFALQQEEDLSMRAAEKGERAARHTGGG